MSLGSSRESAKQLYSIKEEKPQLESSQRNSKSFKQSQSLPEEEKRPSTPGFEEEA